MQDPEHSPVTPHSPSPNFRALIIGQGLAGTCLAIALDRHNADFLVVDLPVAETASRVAAGLVNPAMGKHFRPGWRQDECCAFLETFYPELESRLAPWLDGQKFWQKLPIWREITEAEQLEVWHERQQDPATASWAGPILPWPSGWDAPGQAAYTRTAAVLDSGLLTNAARRWLASRDRFLEIPTPLNLADITPIPGTAEEPSSSPTPPAGFLWNGQRFSHVIWCTGWQFGQSFGKLPGLERLLGRPAQGTILDIELPGFDWQAGIIHFGHWLVPSLHEPGVWRFGATYAWQWADPGVPGPLDATELLHDLASRYHGEVRIVRARAAVRPIIRRSQPLAGPIPLALSPARRSAAQLQTQAQLQDKTSSPASDTLPDTSTEPAPQPSHSGHWMFAGLGSKGVTTAPWTANLLASALLHGSPIPPDLDPARI